jgi:hypothetical protein
VLWHYATGMTIQAPPGSYTLGGKEYVVVAAGPAGINFADPRFNKGAPTLEGHYAHPTSALITAFTLP